MDLLNEIASYLGSKPYVETYQLIAKMGQLKDEVVETEEIKEVKKGK